MTRSLVPLRRTRALGIVLPIHDEEQLLPAALESVTAAVDRLAGNVRCHTVLVFDRCRDLSQDVADSWRNGLTRWQGIHVVSEVEIDAGNVGTARRTGCAAILGSAAELHIPARATWLATTDADSMVPAHWLTTQLASHESGTDLWSGTVAVQDWRRRWSGTATEWRRRYEEESDPAHGASLGVNGQVYLDAGQFEERATGEDRALLDAVSRSGASCLFDRSAPVTTSARRDARAPGGFAHALGRIEEELRATSRPADLDDVSA